MEEWVENVIYIYSEIFWRYKNKILPCVAILVQLEGIILISQAQEDKILHGYLYVEAKILISKK